jgi:hypothetical protein
MLKGQSRVTPSTGMRRKDFNPRLPSTFSGYLTYERGSTDGKQTSKGLFICNLNPKGSWGDLFIFQRCLFLHQQFSQMKFYKN